MSVSRNRRFVRYLGLLAAFAILGATPGWSETLQEVMKKRELSQQDVLAAGQSGMVIVYGIPSMRILKYIAVFNPGALAGLRIRRGVQGGARTRAASTARTSPGATPTTRRSPRRTATTTASTCSSTTRRTRAWR